jgi:Xaa-Pro aminopeptidase
MNRDLCYDFSRYVDHMAKVGWDAIIASNYNVTSRMRNYYFKDEMWMAVGLREFNPFVGCDSKGEIIPAHESIWARWTLEQSVGNLIDVLTRRGLDRGTIGLEMLDFPARALLMLQEALPNAAFADASWVIHQDMAKKTEREIRFIEHSVKACEAGFRNVMGHIREALGRPQPELMWRYFSPEVNRHNAELIGSNITSMAWEWSEREKAPLVEEGGTPINFDILCGYEGLMSDIAFRGMVGQPDSKYQEFFEKSTRVVDVLVRSIKPGLTAAEAEAACLDGMKREVGSWGGGDNEYWAVHGSGFHVHEFPQVGKPYVGGYGDYVFEVGNVLSVEAIAEQTFVLREDGMHRLGEMPMKIYSA